MNFDFPIPNLPKIGFAGNLEAIEITKIYLSNKTDNLSLNELTDLFHKTFNEVCKILEEKED